MSQGTYPGEVRRSQATEAASSSMLPFALAGLLLFGIAYGGFKLWQVRQYEVARADGTPITVAPLPLNDFTLEERGGTPFRSANMQGRVWVASYFFASCIGPCRILNGNIQELSKDPDLQDVTWVSITCDPDNDSLAVLKKYADDYKADPERWLFCRADLDYLKGVARGMNLALFIKSHSDHLVVVDRAGTIRGMFDGTSKRECQQLRGLVRECLAEKPPAKDDNEKVETTAEKLDLGQKLPGIDTSIECCDDEPIQPASRSGT